MINDIIRPDEYVGIKQAVTIIDRKERQLRRWYKDEPRLGRQPIGGGRIELSLPALFMYRVGNAEALELYWMGEREHPRVKPFIDAVLDMVRQMRGST